MKIKSIKAYEIIASGGYPSIEARVELEDGSFTFASVAYGASAGSHEACVLTDQDPDRFEGKGMQKAVSIIETVIAPELIDKEISQSQLDQIMIDLDGTKQKTKLGGNSILVVSLAAAKAAAKSQGLQLFEYIAQTFDLEPVSKLPQPMVVSIEGGKHADHSTDLQEYCLTVVGDMSAHQSVQTVLETYHSLKKLLREQKLSTNVGNEGAFAPSGLSSNQQPLDLLMQAIDRSGYSTGHDLGISIDAAASEFFENNQYRLQLENLQLSSEELLNYYQPWLAKFPIVSLEDMFAEDDWTAWTKFNQLTSQHNILHLGDDLTVTNQQRLQKAIDLNAISAILIKLNQIGSLTETVECCKLAVQNQIATIPSHRGGGETNDSSMVDLAVAVGSRFIKVGPTRGERVSKYNRLLEIERYLQSS